MIYIKKQSIENKYAGRGMFRHVVCKVYRTEVGCNCGNSWDMEGDFQYSTMDNVIRTYRLHFHQFCKYMFPFTNYER